MLVSGTQGREVFGLRTGIQIWRVPAGKASGTGIMRACGRDQREDYLAKTVAEYKETLQNLGRDFEEEGATNDLADSIDRLLGHWFVEHIKNVDQKLGDFLKEKGIVLEAEEDGPES